MTIDIMQHTSSNKHRAQIRTITNICNIFRFFKHSNANICNISFLLQKLVIKIDFEPHSQENVGLDQGKEICPEDIAPERVLQEQT